jgi:hypothetical protein
MTSGSAASCPLSSFSPVISFHFVALQDSTLFNTFEQVAGNIFRRLTDALQIVVRQRSRQEVIADSCQIK